MMQNEDLLLTMSYPILLTLHLFAALFFVGTVFFEVLMLEGVRKHVPRDVMRTMEIAIGTRARRIMPWVLLRSEEHTSELQSPMRISYAVFSLTKKKTQKYHTTLILIN